MIRFLFALCVIGIPFQAFAQTPIVVELFSYPGCDMNYFEHVHENGERHASALHKSDLKKDIPSHVFGKLLAENDHVIGIHCMTGSVGGEEYTESQETCGNRHYDYMKTLDPYELYNIGNMVINGRYEVSGELQNVLNASVNLAKSENTVHPIQLSITDNVLDISLPKMRLEHGAELFVFSYTESFEKDVSDDLNKPMMVKYPNPVEDIQQLSDWGGEYSNLSVPINPDYAGIALIAQDSITKQIIAAGKLEL